MFDEAGQKACGSVVSQVVNRNVIGVHNRLREPGVRILTWCYGSTPAMRVRQVTA